MSKVTRIAISKNLNQGKYDQLAEIAARCGRLRTEIWDRYGTAVGVAGVGLSHREIRDAWLAEGREFGLPARVWKQTLSDVMSDIQACREAAKVQVRRAIWQHTGDKQERIRLFSLLKSDRWTEDSYLRRMMRRYWKRGHTRVRNQIVLDTQCYKSFELKGKVWLSITGLVPRQRIAIPLNTTVSPTGTIRLILREGRVEVHYAVDEQEVTVTRPPGEQVVGVDKGYSEVFTDSDGDHHGEGLGEMLSAESDHLKLKNARRNKLHALEQKHTSRNPAKAARIRANNLGRKKLNRRRKAHRQRVRDLVFKAAHSVVDKAEVVASEDLTAPIKSRGYGKNQNRRLSGWVKGVIAEALDSVTRRRGSALRLVNAAYTSQMDSRHGVLLGERRGDSFYCFDGVVLDADQNAARNILARLSDAEISLYTSYRQVKDILVRRTEQFKTAGTGSAQAPVAAAPI